MVANMQKKRASAMYGVTSMLRMTHLHNSAFCTIHEDKWDDGNVPDPTPQHVAHIQVAVSRGRSTRVFSVGKEETANRISREIRNVWCTTWAQFSALLPPSSRLELRLR